MGWIKGIGPEERREEGWNVKGWERKDGRGRDSYNNAVMAQRR